MGSNQKESGSASRKALQNMQLSKRRVVEWKIYFDRARMYLGYINFVMLAYVFLNSIEMTEIRSVLDEYKLLIYPAVMIIFVLISLWLGFMDTKLGMRQEELRNYAASNPVMMEILDSVNELKSKL